MIVLGVCQNTIYLGLCFVAVQWVPAGVVVVIASLLPCWWRAPAGLFSASEAARWVSPGWWPACPGWW
ncbi:MAG: hypothetical protein R3E83_07470 [Burkholderiaceae bacterium]